MKSHFHGERNGSAAGKRFNIAVIDAGQTKITTQADFCHLGGILVHVVSLIKGYT